MTRRELLDEIMDLLMEIDPEDWSEAALRRDIDGLIAKHLSATPQPVTADSFVEFEAGNIASESDFSKRVVLRLSTNDPEVVSWWDEVRRDERSHVQAMTRFKMSLMEHYPETWGKRSWKR